VREKERGRERKKKKEKERERRKYILKSIHQCIGGYSRHKNSPQ